MGESYVNGQSEEHRDAEEIKELIKTSSDNQEQHSRRQNKYSIAIIIMAVISLLLTIIAIIISPYK